MTFSIRPGDGGVFYLSGEFDLAEMETFAMAVDACMVGQRDLIFDLTDLRFINSSGLQAIAAVSTQVAPRPIVLRGATPSVAKVLEIVGFSHAPGIRIEYAERAGAEHSGSLTLIQG